MTTARYLAFCACWPLALVNFTAPLRDGMTFFAILSVLVGGPCCVVAAARLWATRDFP